MRYVNLHLIAIIVILGGLLGFSRLYQNETFVFFGLAENKEMEIRLEHPAIIEQTYVLPGQNVKKGDLLFKVKRSGIALTQSDLTHEIATLQSQLQLWEAELKGSINRLVAQKIAQENEIKNQIEQLESEMFINQSLMEGLESITPAKDKTDRSPNEIKIEGLKKDLELSVNPLKTEIKNLQQELNTPQNPIKIQINKLKKELGFVYQDEKELKIFAQSDGVIGSVFCKIGEQFPAYATLLTFYEANPNQVKGYVLESLILNVKMGDTIIVESGVHSDYQCKGEVIGVGSRIVEIPERLRKNPTFKTYGVEVQIRISSENHFLQKEKVTLKLSAKHNFLSNQKIIQALSPCQTVVSLLEKTNQEY